MGQGRFGLDRPFTDGDEGWLGIDRPLVGAANGIEATVTTDSAAQVAVANSTPDTIENVRMELNEINRQLDNKEKKLQRISDGLAFGEISPADGPLAERRRDKLMEEVRMLEGVREDLRDELRRARNQLEQGNLPPGEVEEGIAPMVRSRLSEVGVSSGPFIDVGGATTTITFSKANIREEDIAMTREILEDIGFQVSDVTGVEI